MCPRDGTLPERLEFHVYPLPYGEGDVLPFGICVSFHHLLCLVQTVLEFRVQLLTRSDERFDGFVISHSRDVMGN